MDKVFIISIFVTLLFCVIKFIEMRYLEKDTKPLKFFVRDAIIVFLSGVASTFSFFYLENYISDFFNIVTETKTLNTNATEIFTDSPGF
jgi:hypothetical protein